mmetsp:Transcript_32401/g.66977  ORF Transcript_32401/g.66977 Transcript_32401/m.66977 type:complete len:302 (-) Transcript_32401:593-1498(-)
MSRKSSKKSIRRRRSPSFEMPSSLRTSSSSSHVSVRATRPSMRARRSGSTHSCRPARDSSTERSSTVHCEGSAEGGGRILYCCSHSSSAARRPLSSSSSLSTSWPFAGRRGGWLLAARGVVPPGVRRRRTLSLSRYQAHPAMERAARERAILRAKKGEGTELSTTRSTGPGTRKGLGMMSMKSVRNRSLSNGRKNGSSRNGRIGSNMRMESTKTTERAGMAASQMLRRGRREPSARRRRERARGRRKSTSAVPTVASEAAVEREVTIAGWKKAAPLDRSIPAGAMQTKAILNMRITICTDQ